MILVIQLYFTNKWSTFILTVEYIDIIIQYLEVKRVARTKNLIGREVGHLEKRCKGRNGGKRNNPSRNLVRYAGFSLRRIRPKSGLGRVYQDPDRHIRSDNYLGLFHTPDKNKKLNNFY